MTDIEQFLFGGNIGHGIVEFTLALGSIRLRLAPWKGEGVSHEALTEATFPNTKLLSLWQTEEPEEDELNLPWDIIGFDNYELTDGRWKFVLNCMVVEWCWESEWPTVERASA
jgi:hypothetical protein